MRLVANERTMIVQDRSAHNEGRRIPGNRGVKREFGIETRAGLAGDRLSFLCKETCGLGQGDAATGTGGLSGLGYV
jgi:hypothetical protein